MLCNNDKLINAVAGCVPATSNISVEVVHRLHARPCPSCAPATLVVSYTDSSEGSCGSRDYPDSD